MTKRAKVKVAVAKESSALSSDKGLSLKYIFNNRVLRNLKSNSFILKPISYNHSLITSFVSLLDPLQAFIKDLQCRLAFYHLLSESKRHPLADLNELQDSVP